MAWIRLDDNAPWHPKHLKAGPLASWLWVCGLAYCQRHATDGFIPVEAMHMLGATGPWKPLASALVKAGLWIEAEGGYRVHDFLDWNDSREEREGRAEFNRRRAELFRDRDLRRLVRERDKDKCRYCGVTVEWQNRRGPHGGTYDHVNPKGPNSAENLVVACRSCNSSKRGQINWTVDLKQVGFSSGSKSDPVPNHPTPTPTPIKREERTPTLIAPYLDKKWAFDGGTFRVPASWEISEASKSGGRMTGAMFQAFYAHFATWVKDEQPDLTGNRLFQVLDRELARWRERKASDDAMAQAKARTRLQDARNAAKEAFVRAEREDAPEAILTPLRATLDRLDAQLRGGHVA